MRENATAGASAARRPEDQLGLGGLESLRQPVPAADDLGRIVEIQLVVLVGELLLERLGDVLLVHRQHQHLVVGQQVLLDGLAEAEAMQLRAEVLDVVHRSEFGGGFLGLALASSP